MNSGGQIVHCMVGEGSSYYLCLKRLERVNDLDTASDPWHFSQWREAGSEFRVSLAQESPHILSPMLWWKHGSYIVVSY